jgi:hypothetical protein
LNSSLIIIGLLDRVKKINIIIKNEVLLLPLQIVRLLFRFTKNRNCGLFELLIDLALASGVILIITFVKSYHLQFTYRIDKITKYMIIIPGSIMGGGMPASLAA